MVMTLAAMLALLGIVPHVSGLRRIALSPLETKPAPLISIWDLSLGSPEEEDPSQLILEEVTNPNDENYLHHVRKAGGTTMRKWMNALCKEKGYEKDDFGKKCVWIKEGGAITDRTDDELFGAESKFKVELIHFREPVARAQSLINMNLATLARCCQDPDPEWSVKHCYKLDCSLQTVDKQISATRCYSTRSSEDGNIPLWNCLDNVYVKSLVGTNSRDPTSSTWGEVTEEDFNIAKKRLAKFNGVLITEWFKFSETAEYLSKEVFHMNHTIPFITKNAVKHSPDHEFTKQQWAEIAVRNKFDTRLYEYAKELLLKRMKDAGYARGFSGPAGYEGFAKISEEVLRN